MSIIDYNYQQDCYVKSENRNGKVKALVAIGIDYDDDKLCYEVFFGQNKQQSYLFEYKDVKLIHSPEQPTPNRWVEEFFDDLDEEFFDYYNAIFGEDVEVV